MWEKRKMQFVFKLIAASCRFVKIYGHRNSIPIILCKNFRTYCRQKYSRGKKRGKTSKISTLVIPGVVVKGHATNRILAIFATVPNFSIHKGTLIFNNDHFMAPFFFFLPFEMYLHFPFSSFFF